MSDDQLNQTQFLSSEHATTVSVPTDTPSVKKPPILLYAILGVGMLFCVVFAMTYFYVQRTRQTTVVISTPTPAPQVLETSGIRSTIAPLLQKIEQSNPENDEHPFPPVDFKVRITDPGAR